MRATEREDDRPWWRYGYVWLLLAGPSAVIAAGAVTVVLAVRLPDPVIEDYYHQQAYQQARPQVQAARAALLREGGLANPLASSAPARIDPLAPAMIARNHAATGLAQTGR